MHVGLGVQTFKGRLRAVTLADGCLGGNCARFNGHLLPSTLKHRLMLPWGMGSTGRHYPQRMVPFPRDGKHFHQKAEVDTRQYLSVQGKEATNIKLLIQETDNLCKPSSAKPFVKGLHTSISTSGCMGEGEQERVRPTQGTRLSGLRPLVIWLKRSPRRKEAGHLSTGALAWAKVQQRFDL